MSDNRSLATPNIQTSLIHTSKGSRVNDEHVLKEPEPSDGKNVTPTFLTVLQMSTVVRQIVLVTNFRSIHQRQIQFEIEHVQKKRDQHNYRSTHGDTEKCLGERTVSVEHDTVYCFA